MKYLIVMFLNFSMNAQHNFDEKSTLWIIAGTLGMISFY